LQRIGFIRTRPLPDDATWLQQKEGRGRNLQRMRTYRALNNGSWTTIFAPLARASSTLKMPPGAAVSVHAIAKQIRRHAIRHSYVPISTGCTRHCQNARRSRRFLDGRYIKWMVAAERNDVSDG
jgi:hypothetical protein